MTSAVPSLQKMFNIRHRHETCSLVDNEAVAYKIRVISRMDYARLIVASYPRTEIRDYDKGATRRASYHEPEVRVLTFILEGVAQAYQA
jgi:hypothetical protein